MLLFSFDYPPHSGGIARLTFELARGFFQRGVEVSVLTGRPREARLASQPPAPPEERIEGGTPLLQAAAWRRLRRVRRGDAVVCGIWYPEGLTARLAGARPLVVLAHGAELLDGASGPEAGMRRHLRRRILESADLVVANSEYTRALVSSAAPRSKAVTVLPGTDTSRFAPAAGEKRPGSDLLLGSVSRLFRYKGHEVVFRALAGLPQPARRRVGYRIAGRGPDEAHLRNLARALGVHDRVEWCGHVPEAELVDFYRATDLFVLCSREEPEARRVEGFGLAFLEAQACGVPAVGTRSGGVSEAVEEGDGGWLIAADDHPALGRLLLRLLEDPESRRRAGRAARARVERAFSLEHYLERFSSALSAAGLWPSAIRS